MENQRSIADINRMVRGIVEAETLGHFYSLSGKIERAHKSKLGHIYFWLVDGPSRVNCIIFEDLAGQLPFEIRNGQDVTVNGEIRFYEAHGNAEIKVKNISLDDKLQFTEPAIDQLRDEGLYPFRKKPPPGTIRRIGIITSKSSRAVGDFESAYRSASPREVLAPYVFEYVILEGERARHSVIDAIRTLDIESTCDVIAIIRGGGRGTNLATFDDIDIARAILNCKTYLVTGIGHYKDSTLADKMADHAAATPTASAVYLAEICKRQSETNKFADANEFSANAQTPNTTSATAKRFLLALFALAALILLATFALVGNSTLQ